MPLQGDELPSFFQSSIPHSTQLDLPDTHPANPADPVTGFEDYGFMFTDAGMLGVNDDDAAAAFYAAGGTTEIQHHAAAAPCCAAGGTTGIQHLEEEDAQSSWSVADLERLIREVDPLTAPDEKLAPAPEDGRTSGRDADMPEVNKAVFWADDVRRAIEWDLLMEGHKSTRRARDALDVAQNLRKSNGLEPLPDDTAEYTEKLVNKDTEGVKWSTVKFTGPTKERKPNQPGWKEKSMKGLRADPSSPQPPETRQQEQEQRYVGMKKTLEKDDDGKGNKWRAHEYTPLVPSDDGSDILVPAEISLRLEFKVDEREDEQPASATSTKRKEDEPPSAPPAFTKRPKTEPKRSAVWKRMTKVHVKVATTMDGSQRKKPCYKVMFAICHHCDKVFNADSANGTNNLSKHLLDTGCCKDCKCTHSHLR